MKALSSIVLAVLLALAPLATASSTSAAARASVDAHYEISIAGWRIAQAKLDLKLVGDRYDAALTMQPKGVARIVTAVRTAVGASGRVRGGKVLASRYTVSAEEIDRPVRVTMAMRSGTVTKLSAKPPMKQKPGRIPVTASHRRGIVDPLSSGLIPSRAPDARDACNHTLKIFDGWTRYDVRLSFKTTTTVSTEGYSGPAAVCAARWVPVAGHRPQKKEVQYLAANKRLEMTVIPLKGFGVAIPYSVEIGTPNGLIRIEPSRMAITGAGV